MLSIGQLEEGMKDWKIKIVVVHKNHPRSWKNAKGTGRLMNFEICDYFNKDKETFEEGELI